jgi:hypothetical protein
VQALSAENAMYKEWSGKSIAEMELLSNKAVVLEVPICQSYIPHFWCITCLM